MHVPLTADLRALLAALERDSAEAYVTELAADATIAVRDVGAGPAARRSRRERPAADGARPAARARDRGGRLRWLRRDRRPLRRRARRARRRAPHAQAQPPRRATAAAARAASIAARRSSSCSRSPWSRSASAPGRRSRRAATSRPCRPVDDRPELVRLRGRRLPARLDPGRAEPRARAAQADQPVAAEGDGRRRGPALLPARRRRLRGHRARALEGRQRRQGRRGRLDDRAAARRATSTPAASARFERKLKEACLAIKLSRRWSKNRILREYLNTVYYGNHAYGVEAASQTYFSAHARRA